MYSCLHGTPYQPPVPIEWPIFPPISNLLAEHTDPTQEFTQTFDVDFDGAGDSGSPAIPQPLQRRPKRHDQRRLWEERFVKRKPWILAEILAFRGHDRIPRNCGDCKSRIVSSNSNDAATGDAAEEISSDTPNRAVLYCEQCGHLPLCFACDNRRHYVNPLHVRYTLKGIRLGAMESVRAEDSSVSQ